MTFLATDGDGIARASTDGRGRWSVAHLRLQAKPHALAVDPFSATTVYAGTAVGVLRSDDAGLTWRSAGLAGRDIRAVAASPAAANLVLAGTRPSALFVSRDGADSWAELRALRTLARRRAFFSPAEWPPIAYVSAIALSAGDSKRIVVGFEVGGVAATDDGGVSWRVGRGAIYDCHSLAAHPRDALRFYQGGAGLRKAGRTSTDGGFTWSGPRTTDGRSYGWAAVGDPEQPDVWFYSASSSPFKGHTLGRAAAVVYRVRGGAPAECVGGGFPDAVADMPYQLLAHDGSLYAGLANGDIWRSADHGYAWERLAVNLGRIERTFVITGPFDHSERNA